MKGRAQSEPPGMSNQMSYINMDTCQRQGKQARSTKHQLARKGYHSGTELDVYVCGAHV